MSPNDYAAIFIAVVLFLIVPICIAAAIAFGSR
jgi:hypothetical protein